jgi:L-threonylcarbamoyladenylate synthase
MAANAETIAEAARCLANTGLVAFPTETVYGLGADGTNGTAIARLYDAKGRPAFNPLIAHVESAAAARRLGAFDGTAARLAAACWPGPLTLVLPRLPDCPVVELATAGLDAIAVRVPCHEVARDLLAIFGRPIVAPSANRSGHVSPTTAQHVLADLHGRIDLVLDGGPAPVGIESTIIACLGEPILLRPGGVSRTEIESVLGRTLTEPPVTDQSSSDEMPLAPGQLVSHYAPRSPMRLDASSVKLGEALLAFGAALPAGSERAVRTLNLSPSGDLIEAAANLFAYLRMLDGVGATAIAVMPVPRDGLGEAINDRIGRAAAPRP